MTLQYLEDIEKVHSCDGRRHMDQRCHPGAAKFVVMDAQVAGELKLGAEHAALSFCCAVCEARICVLVVENQIMGKLTEGENYAAAVAMDGWVYLGNPPAAPLAALKVARRCELQKPQQPC